VHLTSNPIAWYAARGAGVSAYVLLSAVIVVGLLLAGRATILPRPRIAVVDLHRFGGMLISLFIVIHVAAIGIDSYLPFSVSDLLVPFVSKVRPLWMGLGIVAAELLLALGVTNALVRRKKVPYRIWRMLHYGNWGVWVLATVHSVGVGTDRSTPWLMATTAACAASVAAAAAWRTMRRSASWHGLAGGAAVVCAALTTGATLGPLAVVTRAWDGATFNDQLTGTIQNQSGGSRGLISLAGDGTGDQRVFVRVDLLLTPSGTKSTSLQVEYLTSGNHCVGEVTSIASDGFGFTGTCTLPGGQPERRTITGKWDGTNTGSELVGTITSRPAS
jgi:sulfoxide reductase heme-binding subunit YedZ